MKAGRIYLETLGSFGISESGRPLSIPRAKEKALIAFLAVNAGRPFQRDYLSNLLWASASESNAKHSLNNALHTIKRIAPTLLTIQPTSIEMSSETIDTDLDAVDRFIRDRSVLANLASIRGEFLADLHIRDAPDFESWKSDFSRQLFSTINTAAKAELATLDVRDQAAAIMRVASLATVSSAIEIPEGVDIAVKANPHQSPRPPKQNTSAFSLPLVGREPQLATLYKHWVRSQSGTPQFVTISGHAGHGKTRLIDEFSRSLSQGGARVLRARCYRSERRIAFGPILEMFAAQLSSADLAGIDPIWLAALHDVIPTLPVEQNSAPQLSPVASQSRLYEAFLRLINAIAQRGPAFVFVDDVQWADASTQALLSFLAHRVQTPLMLVVSERSYPRLGERRPPWRSWPNIAVEELSEEHLTEVVRRLPQAISSAIPSVTQLDRLTRGHPYMVTEIIRSASQADISEIEKPLRVSFAGVDAFIGALLSELPANAQRIISALSVIGRPASISLTAKVSRAKAIIDGLDLLLEKGLIDRGSGTISLRHDLLRESTYKRLSTFTRTELHRRAALALASNSRYVGETAEHYYRARDRRNTLAFAMKAYEDAESRYASEESIYFLRMAMKAANSERCKIRLLLAEKLYRASRMREAAEQIRRITSKPALLSDSSFMLWRLRELELAYNSGTLSGASLRFELERFRERLPPTETACLNQLLFVLAHCAFHDGERALVQRYQRALKALADQLHPGEAISALASAVRGHVTVTSATEADTWAEPLREGLHTIVDPELKIKVLSALSSVAYGVGRLSESSHYATRGLQEIERVGAMNEWPKIAANVHMLDVEQGRFIEAALMFEQIERRAPDHWDLVAASNANASLMHYIKGEFTLAKSFAEAGIRKLDDRKSTWTELALRGQIGISALQLGDLSTAFKTAAYLEQKVDSLGARMNDLSFVEILIARVATLRGQKVTGMTRLQAAIEDYRDRDIICRLRMQLELARMLKTEDRAEARALAKEVFGAARACNAVTIADDADGLLIRL